MRLEDSNRLARIVTVAILHRRLQPLPACAAPGEIEEYRQRAAALEDEIAHDLAAWFAAGRELGTHPKWGRR